MVRPSQFLPVLLAPAVALPLPALANDSTAGLSAGGLVLQKTADIEMRSEDLSVSADKIRVAYVFRNRADHDVTTLVAFPMPDVTFGGEDDNISIPGKDPVNFLDFRVTVGGKPVAIKAEQKAFKEGKEITALLTGLHVPLQPWNEAAAKALEALPKKKQDEIVAMGAAIRDDYDAGKGMEHHLAPAWTVTTKFYWTQTFPAGADLKVEHEYKPAYGSSVGSVISLDHPNAKALADYKARYCIDADFDKAVAKARAAVKNGETYLSEQTVDYILTAGANWAGPIGDFHLTVDKGDPAALVSFCGTGVKKIGPTQFEVRYRNYTPKDDLHVLILHGH